jgi:hypothetical protein
LAGITLAQRPVLTWVWSTVIEFDVSVCVASAPGSEIAAYANAGTELRIIFVAHLIV